MGPLGPFRHLVAHNRSIDIHHPETTRWSSPAYTKAVEKLMTEAEMLVMQVAEGAGLEAAEGGAEACDRAGA